MSIDVLTDQTSSLRTRAVRRVAVTPAFNEERTVVAVLARLEPLADELIVVDDGSTDRTRVLVEEWAAGRPHVHVLGFEQNRGMSAAYYRAFEEIRAWTESGRLDANDVILTVDADGQHEPEEADELVRRIVDDGYDAVIARRDLSIYTPYKRLGNAMVSLWASAWAGMRLYDVESGYRAFRVGALLDALNYYKGYRYSETVEVAVILQRLGYKVDNSFLVPVPVFRSNTRLKDLAIDIAAMPAAWWRVVAGRDRPLDFGSLPAYALSLLGPALLLFFTLNLLVHRLLLANDSMESYSHVWYLNEQLFDRGSLPFHIALLDSGKAITFPYAFVPYLVGAAFYEVFGDWSVTLLLVVAALGGVWAACLARPVLRNPWFLLLFVLNPFFIDMLYSFQFATAWSLFAFFLFVWTFERQRYLLAAPLLWLAISSHPIMGTFAVLLYVGATAVLYRSRLRQLLLVCLATAPALVPVYWMTLQTPAVGENSAWKILGSVLDTITRRGTMFLLPFVLAAFAVTVRRHYRRTLGAFAVASFAGLAFVTGPVYVGDLNRGDYMGAFRSSHDIYASYFGSPAFEPGATYRVMEPKGREDGMYRFIKHGAVLSNDFFSESLQRRNWQMQQYDCYLAFKRVDYVVVERAYISEYKKDEATLLARFVDHGDAKVAYIDPRGRFTVYNVRDRVEHQQRPASLRDCRLF